MTNSTADIRCPQCFSEEDLSIHADGEASVRTPITDGKADPCFEVLRENAPPGSDEVLLQYSSIEGRTRITIFKDTEMSVYCPKCEKLFRVEGSTVKCNDVK